MFFLKKISLLLCVVICSSQVFASWVDAEYAHGQSQIDAETLITAVNAKQVAFIDTREAEEYNESHIPGAVNISLRELDKVDVATLSKYQYVVPYCLKDFRGFEMAKKLRDLGLNNVVLMEPAGFNGWRKLDLPVVTENITTEQALAALAKR